MKYLLILMLGGTAPAQIGPFDNILACEKAASQSFVVARELGHLRVGTVCVSTKDPSFKFKEPKK